MCLGLCVSLPKCRAEKLVFRVEGSRKLSNVSGQGRKPFSVINGFLGIGVVITIGIFWWGGGQPGVPLGDGDYGCAVPGGGGLGSLPGPGATVVDGEVVDAWHFDIATGTQTSVLFSDVEQKSPGRFNMVSVNWRGDPYQFECTDD
jgi:hypothetical protein